MTAQFYVPPEQLIKDALGQWQGHHLFALHGSSGAAEACASQRLSLSAGLGKPLIPPSCRSVANCSARPVRILCT